MTEHTRHETPHTLPWLEGLLCLLCFTLAAAAQDKDNALMCASEVRWMNCGESKVFSKENGSFLHLNLFTTASKPADMCLPAEIRLTVTFFDREEDFICSGVIENAATQGTHTQSTNIEIRPLNTLEFVRWRNGPRPTAVRPKRLLCMNPDGLAEIPAGELERATLLKIHATVLPRSGGVSTAECRVGLQP